VCGLSNLIPLKSRSVGSDRITKLLSFALVFGMLQSILIGVQIQYATEAKAVPLTATNDSVCNQEVGSTTNVVAYRISGGDCVVEFKNVGTTTWQIPISSSNFQFLIVGGGAAGMIDGGGGGGGGGSLYLSSIALTTGASANIQIGAGGNADSYTGGGTTQIDLNGDSTYDWNAPGGNIGTGWVSRLGGSGGTPAAQGSATVATGGSGAAGPSSTNAQTAASGTAGNGYTSSITGTSLTYGGGGGGGIGSQSGGTTSADLGPSAGGSGGGGAGAAQRSKGTIVTWNYLGTGGGSQSLTANCVSAAHAGSTAGFDGLAGFGGGGGGGSAYGDGCSANTTTDGERNRGGFGGSGVAIFRYTPDTTAPTYVSSSVSVNGLNLTLTYSETLSATTAAPANFVVTVNSSETRTINSVSASGSSITLGLSRAIEAGQSVSITYSDPTAGNDLNAIQDLARNDAVSISNQAVVNYVNSSIDSALTLNGTNQSASASGAQVIPTSTASAFTVEAWIRQPASRSSGALYQILSQGTGDNQFYFKVLNGSVIFSRSGYTSENTCSVGLTTEEWTHVAVVVGTNTQSCYINGSLAGSFAQISERAIGTTFAVGRYVPSGGENFLGQIDEVKIWSDARTQSEIQTGLKTYGGSLADNLVAYYDFNELVGNRVLNRSTGGSSAFDLITLNTPSIASASIIETSTVQAYTVVKFMRTFLVASGGWTSPATPKRIKYLVVGGGGGGGINVGGGGAGGGGYKVTNQTLLTSSLINITVGVGGVGGLSSYNGSALVDGQSGGSSSVTVGATTYVGTGGSGGETYHASNFCGGSGAVSAYSTAGSFTGSGGVGFTGGLGGSPSNSQSTANGKTGFIDSITGTAQHYGSGGGAGEWPGGGMVRGLGVNSISGNGGSFGVVGSNAVTNTGAGGGAGGGNCSNGGNGASGVVVLAYITNDPSITTQPTNDTTTVGTVDTFTITTTTLPTPLTKLVNWQVATDTTTATASVSWQNVTLGTGLNTDTYTTQTLTLSMNKYRYRAIVTFTDMDSLTVIETSTVVTLTVNPAITITSETSTITRKYGDTQTVRTLVYSGGTTNTGAVGTTTSHTVRGSFGTQASGRIVLDTSTATAVFRVDTGTVVGSYVETITVTDAKGATATYTQRVVVNPADTLTVQADTLTAITFGATLNPTVTVTGLKNGDTVASATFGSVSCANGGLCAIGDIGPGGGVVFHLITNMSDSQTAIAGYTSGGIYLEAAPVGWGNGIAVSAGETTGTAYLDPVVNWCNTTGNTGATQVGVGQGANNTRLGDIGCTSGAVQIAADLVLNGRSDWYLPSQNELEQMGLQKNLVGLIYGQTNCWGKTCYWSSSEVGGGSSSRALQVNVGTNVMGSNDKLLTASNQVMMRPIRAFSPITNNTETVTAGAPTAAGTYSLRPTAITLANSVNTNNYVAIIYRSSPVTINRAFENPRISMQPAKVVYETGTATQALTASSGVGTGAIFYMIGAGSAAGCSISGSTVRSTSDGVCNVIAFKQASTNYLADSATAVAITFTRFAERQLQVQLYPSMIPLNQGNALETTTVTAATLTISAITRTGAGAYTITGTGFTNIDLVSIGGAALTGSNYTRASSTTLTLSGVSSFVGPLLIRLADGQESVLFQFEWN
jgi:uncharacterized repeat protein (TIGR02059 family)